MRCGTSRTRQRGIAVLTAVLVVTLATVLAVNLLWQSSVDLRRTETLLLQDQAHQYDLGGEELARVFLVKDYRNDPNGMDTTKEIWATPLKRDFDGGFFEGWLLDQQGRFDLNSLVGADGKPDEKACRQFVRMLTLLPLDSQLDASTATGLMEKTVDWIDPAPAIARRVSDLLGPPGSEADHTGAEMIFTSKRPHTLSQALTPFFGGRVPA